MLVEGKRIADDNIYLNEPRYDKPKEVFKFVGRCIQEGVCPEGASILDVGCATGELIHYLKQILPASCTWHGMDVSGPMIEAARRNVPGARFTVASLLEEKNFTARGHDVVSCCAVVSIFDDLEKPIHNLLACAKAGGMVVLGGLFNEDPVDVLVRYRRADQGGRDWESGWNIFSRHEVERILRGSGYELKWEWFPFRMPFALKRTPGDPLRSWTIATEANPFQVVNGTCQLLHQDFVRIRIVKTPA